MKLRTLFSLLFFLLTLPLALADGVVDKFLASPAIRPQSVAVLITDLSNGKTVVSYNESKPLIPASIMKTVTIASLLEESGSDYIYHTKVYTDGHIRDGHLEGNLVVVGSGDPSLNASCEPRSSDILVEIRDALRKKGVRNIDGRLIIDCQVFGGPACPPTWASGDLAQSYGTGCHGLNFERNASGKRAVSNPVSVFENRLKAVLVADGVTFGNESIREGNRSLLVDHKSAPISEIMRSCMMRSDNLFAESLLRTIPVLKGKCGTTDGGTSYEMERWKKTGAPMAGVNIVDGSGLSRSNRLTAQFLDSVLAHMSGNVDFASFLPLAGQEGTLKRFLAGTPLDSYIALKTGSMNGIQCYAGYKLDDDFAPTHSVVVIINDMGDRTAARAAVEKMLLEVFV
ncbi:MAG: hypothetical protein HDS93_00605 [Bacteroidales bacterium]|nr:hypothetical protein [Bacteroidales bacterium]